MSERIKEKISVKGQRIIKKEKKLTQWRTIIYEIKNMKERKNGNYFLEKVKNVGRKMM